LVQVFRGFSPQTLSLVVFRPVESQYVMADAWGREKLLSLWWLGSRARAHFYNKALPPKPLRYESINGLIY
jgi:hypothetical protein